VRTPRWLSICVLCSAVAFALGLALRSEWLLTSLDASAAPAVAPQPAPQADDGKLRIIAFGAHPDDCEIDVGGVATKWAKLGHHVKFVSVTNGDIGHWKSAGGPLAHRRLKEVRRAAEMFGVKTEVLDIHDGELMPTLENRRTVTRLIREWQADIVIAPRPNDYHPDHRYTGVLVQDAAYMVTVPFFCPDVPYLKKNPVFMYTSDRFERPNPFTPDIVVDIDDVVGTKLDALGIMESQFFEGGANGHEGLIPADEAGRAERHRVVRNGFSRRFASTANEYRDKLRELYGAERAERVKNAEAFELCEYGSQPSKDDLKKLFPFFSSRD
jgi:LmbE family N-acetylglucosaminyl deacetylase